MADRVQSGKGVVMSYIDALDHRRYEEAVKLISNNVRIIGPAGETFGKPVDFLDMLKRFQGRYDVKRMFADGNEVCLLYDFVTTQGTAYMCSWYKVGEGKIEFIRTVFDPGVFTPPKATERPGPIQRND